MTETMSIRGEDRQDLGREVDGPIRRKGHRCGDRARRSARPGLRSAGQTPRREAERHGDSGCEGDDGDGGGRSHHNLLMKTQVY